MISGTHSRWASCAGWWIRRNPTYLISAACMAVGARLYLVEPRTRAGDVGVILLTLGVLQLYEWAVSGIVVLLHRSRRSPEDEPSLLLVTTLFWTGPLAATREMTVNRPHLASFMAVVACVVAMMEMRTVRRLMGLRLGSATQLIAGFCVVMLAAAPPLLTVPAVADGTNELYLYAAWWLLACVAVAGLAVTRGAPMGVVPESWRAFHLELSFLMVTVAAMVAHLAAMNYAFFGHAQYFYASPLIAVVAAVGIDYLARRPMRSSVLTVLACVLPVAAVALGYGRFDAHLPVLALPRLLRDPLLAALVSAGLVWWFGYRRLGHGAFLHLGSLALAWAAYRGFIALRPEPAAMPATHVVHPITVSVSRDALAFVLYAGVAYLLVLAWWRRARAEVVAALLLHCFAFGLLVWERTAAAGMMIELCAGWSCLVALHVCMPRPPLAATIWPVAFLLLVSWGHDFSAAMQTAARVHAAAMVIVLATAGWIWTWTRYRPVAAALVIANVGFYLVRWLLTTSNPSAMVAVVGSFVLLGGGAAISWHKHRLLEICRENVATAKLGAEEAVLGEGGD